jgi:hypothetical protein
MDLLHVVRVYAQNMQEQITSCFAILHWTEI